MKYIAINSIRSFAAAICAAAIAVWTFAPAAHGAEVEEAGYYFSVTVDYGFDEAYEKVNAALKAEGFGVLSETNFQQVMKEKLDKDIPRYLILGTCHPGLVYQVYEMEDWVGILTPCNVVLRELPDGKTGVAIKHAGGLIMATGNPALEGVVQELIEISIRILGSL